MTVPIAGNLVLILHRLDGLEEPFQSTHGDIIADMLRDVGKTQYGPFGDEADNVLRIISDIQVFVIRKPEALILEVVRDAPRPDWVLIRVLRQLPSKKQLG